MNLFILTLSLVGCLFGNTELVTPKEDPLTFEEALHNIVDRTPSVGIQRATLEATQGKNLSTRLALLPGLSVAAKKTSTRSLGVTTNRQGVEASIDLNLFRFGSDVAGIHAAGAEEDRDTLLIDDAILKAESEGVKALVNTVQSEMTVQTLKQIVQTRDDALGIARERFQKGLLALQEVEKFSVDLDNKRAQLDDTDSELAQANANLVNLLGHDRVQIRWPWKDRLPAHLTTLKSIQTPEVSQRPDWRAAERNYDSTRDRANQNWGKILPSLDFTLTYGYYDTPIPAPDYRGTEWTGMVALTIPLFDRFSNLGAYRAELAASKSAELELEKIRRLAKAEWDSSKEMFEISLLSAKARERTLVTSRKLYSDNLQRFKRGLVSANDLLLDQDRLYESELLAIKGWGAAHLNAVRLCHALGKRAQTCLMEKS